MKIPEVTVPERDHGIHERFKSIEDFKRKEILLESDDPRPGFFARFMASPSRFQELFQAGPKGPNRPKAFGEMMGTAFRQISRSNPMILASSSPRRKGLLTQIGLPFRSVPSRLPEEAVGTLGPHRLCRDLARRKAQEVGQRAPGSWILGADTLVVVDGLTLGKPRDAEDAKAMLSLLSGKSHQVMTGFCVVDPSGRAAHSQVVATRVWIKRLNLREIDAYIAGGEPFGKAGGYAIQGIGAFMVERISGSYSNVVGLPLCRVIAALLSVGGLRTFPL